jgi:hypothetical protein
MDDHGQLEYATASGNDYVAHEQTYRTFVTLTRSAIAVVVVILILMAIFLTWTQNCAIVGCEPARTGREAVCADAGGR